MMEAIILAGGKGTRLSPISQGVPKPMVSIAGKPVLDHTVERLLEYGISRVHFFTGFGSQIIKDHFRDGKDFSITASYKTEDDPLGTAGLVVQTLEDLPEEFLVIYGDTIFNIDLDRFISFHHKQKADVTLFLHPNDHPADSDLIEIDEENRILALHPYPHTGEVYLPNMVSAALYIVKKEALLPWAGHTGTLDFAHDIIPSLIAQGKRVFGYVSREYIKDMGTPERFLKVESDILSGKVALASLAHKKPAIFLDRDGTLIREAGYVRSPQELKLEDTAAEAVRLINESGYLAVVITNQPVIARGEVTIQGLKEIHNKLEQDLGNKGAYLNAIYYCPHHPDKGFTGERPEYKVQCTCRKPGIALIERAVEDLAIDLSQSWFIGDKTVDVMTAKNAGIRSALVHTGESGRDAKFTVTPELEVKNILEAVQAILTKNI